MIKPIWLTLANISAWAVCGPGVSEAALEAVVAAAGISPLPSHSQTLRVDRRDARYDAEQVRIAYEAEYGVPATTRGEIPGSKASQRRAPVARQVKQVKQRPVVMGTCAVCGREFVREYRASGHVTHRKTCDDACRAVLLTRNAKASRTNAFNVSIVPNQKVLSGESTG